MAPRLPSWQLTQRRAGPCPACGAREALPVVVGLPGPDLMELAEQGLVALLGCCLPEVIPDYRCRRCGEAWQRPGAG